MFQDSQEDEDEVIPSSQEPEPTPKVTEPPRGRRPNRKNTVLEESIPASPEVVTQTPRSRIRSRRNFSDSPPAQQVNILTIHLNESLFVIVLFFCLGQKG